MIKEPRVLVTGSAGFIGHHLVLALNDPNYSIVGLDSINSYYDVGLKYDRLAIQGFDKVRIQYNKLIQSSISPNISFIQLDLTDEKELAALFREQQFDMVINLAAQAGVRHSIEHPQTYVASNLVGFANILENCRWYSIKHLLFASSSSVYGLNDNVPFQTSHNTDYPISFYAATKKANEVMAHSYSHLFRIPITGLRFFSVYGPWGRPDMAYFTFTKAILEDKPIRIFNYGDMYRDFTYIDDVVNSIIKLLPALPQQGSKATSPNAPFRVFNIGNNKPEHLLDLVKMLERLLNKKASLDLQPMQPADVRATFADVDDLIEATDFKPSTSLEEGSTKFIEWFKMYFKIKPAEVKALA